MKVLLALFVWNPSAFPPTRRSTKSTKTQKAEDTRNEERYETDDEAPVNDESSDISDDDDVEGTNCLNSKIHGGCDFRVKNCFYSCSFYSNCAWWSRSWRCSIQSSRAEGHLSCFIPGPLSWGAFECSSPPNYFVPRKICFKQIIKTKILRPWKCILPSKPKNLAIILVWSISDKKTPRFSAFQMSHFKR